MTCNISKARYYGNVVRPIRIAEGLAYVTLTKGLEAVIDAADIHLVGDYNWYAKESLNPDGSIRTVYAVRQHSCAPGKQRLVRMHRIISGTPNGLETDHVNGDGLDNRRANLRPATSAQNQRNSRIRSDNTSGFKGVVWNKQNKKWVAKIKFGGKNVHLGYYGEKAAAARAYAEANARLHGEFGRVG